MVWILWIRLIPFECWLSFNYYLKWLLTNPFNCPELNFSRLGDQESFKTIEDLSHLLDVTGPLLQKEFLKHIYSDLKQKSKMISLLRLPSNCQQEMWLVLGCSHTMDAIAIQIKPAATVILLAMVGIQASSSLWNREGAHKVDIILEIMSSEHPKLPYTWK